MTKSLSTIIGEIEAQKTVKKQAEVMQKNSSKALKDIIGYAMDPTVNWLLPEGDPPYRPMAESADQEGRLYSETRRLIYFVNTHDGLAVAPLKREQLFIQLLESIDPHDAQLMLRVKSKGLKIKVEAVKIAFPNMSSHW